MDVESHCADLPFTDTIEVRDTCLCLHLQRAARAVARRFDDVLRPFGLTNGQFSLMMSLNRPVPASIKSVAALLGLDRTTLTANLTPLERRGLVSDAVDDADGRTRRLVLTQAGRSLLATAVPAWRREHAAIERRLPEGRADRLRADLITLAGTEEPPG